MPPKSPSRLPALVSASLAVVGLALLAVAPSARAQPPTLKPNLADIPARRGWSSDTSQFELADMDGAPAIRFTQPGGGNVAQVVWLTGFEFTAGTIEFDAKGRSAPPQSNFIGVAFHVVDAKTHDAVYFRPFNFRAAAPDNAAHAVQYVSHPDWGWQRLRKERTGQFEQPLVPAPDGDAWFHARVVVADRQVSVYVNGATTPSLVVPELGSRPGGSVGLWCNGGALIANLAITPAVVSKK